MKAATSAPPGGIANVVRPSYMVSKVSQLSHKSVLRHVIRTHGQSLILDTSFSRKLLFVLQWRRVLGSRPSAFWPVNPRPELLTASHHAQLPQSLWWRQSAGRSSSACCASAGNGATSPTQQEQQHKGKQRAGRKGGRKGDSAGEEGER
jgi:hypothetical protein